MEIKEDINWWDLHLMAERVILEGLLKLGIL